MRQWTHDELHFLMDRNPSLKAKSDAVHAVSRTTPAEREQGKLQMMELYAEAIGCKQIASAQEFVRKAFLRMEQGETLNALCAEYASQKLCHSPLGNDYICFCDEK